MNDELISVKLKCCECEREEEFRDETQDDCWWLADMAGWEETDDGDVCPRCRNMP